MLGPMKEKEAILPSTISKRNGGRWIYRVVGLAAFSCAWLQLAFGGSQWVPTLLDLVNSNSGRPPITIQQWESNGLTDAVQWDKYSLNVMGQRVFIWYISPFSVIQPVPSCSLVNRSGEFHPWRLPVPALWPDVLTKIKAMGMNAVSVYIHW